MKITPEMLRDLKACEDQYNLFVELFPDGVEITEELCVRHAQDFDFEWVAQHLLPKKLWRTLKNTMAPHGKMYEEAMAPHHKAYDQAVTACQEAFCEAKAPHWKAYEETLAREFFRCSQL